MVKSRNRKASVETQPMSANVGIKTEIEIKDDFVLLKKPEHGISLKRSTKAKTNERKRIKKESDMCSRRNASHQLSQNEMKAEPDIMFPNEDTASWAMKFDHIFHIKNAEASLHTLAGKANLDSPEEFRAAAVQEILSILKRALGKRIMEIDNYSPATKTLTFGLVFSKHYFKDTVERGPEGDSAAATTFRDFWGPEVQLRRFPDGGISEAIVWKSVTESDKRMVCSKIIKLVLKRHAAIDSRSFLYFGNLWDSTLLYQRVKLPDQWPVYGSGEEYFQWIIKTYDVLSKDLRSIKDLPLGIANIQSTAPTIRFTEPFPIMPFTFSTEKGAHQQRVWTKFVQPLASSIPMQIVMEGSSKWPDTLQAIRRLKTAFLMLIAEALKNLGYIVIVTNVDTVQIWKDGFCFELEVVYLGEIGISRKIVMSDGRTRLENTPLFKELQYSYELLPKLAGAIAGLGAQHESFGVACRLAKRWIGTQLLDGYVPHECVELLMASIYIYPEPHTAPISPEIALIRFWSLVATYDWQTSPLFLNFNQEWSFNDTETLRRRFRDARSSFPPMVIFTPFDSESIWTQMDFSKLILKRFVALAKTSVEVAQRDRMTCTSSDWKRVFRPPFEEDWDVVIYISINSSSRRHELLDIPEKSKFSNFSAVEYLLTSGGPGRNAMLNFDTVGIFVKSLRKTYGRFAYFLADPAGGLAVFIKWKIANLSGEPFCTSLHGETVSPARCSEQMSLLKPNLSAMVEDFGIMGKGLVDHIEVRSEKWKL